MLSNRHEFELPASLIEAFQEDGAVCVRQLFTPDDVALLTRGIESNPVSYTHLTLPTNREV